ncbi:MAG: hypothetical protein KA715_02610 [Xanthomonadaceae bacterium]|nr:hypothetical protein [Xanthomonadaceae bacterium]
MKKLLAILALTLTPAAHAFDLGLHGGLTMNYFAPGLNYFTYGASGTFYFGSFSSGLKITNLSGPSATSSGLTISTGQLNLLGQFKIQISGLFAGVNFGLGSTSATVSFGGYGATAAASSFIFGPSVGFYFGDKFKIGVEVDYLICTASGWVNTITPMVGVKFALGGGNSGAVQTQEVTPKPEPTVEPAEEEKVEVKKPEAKHKDLPTMESITPAKE